MPPLAAALPILSAAGAGASLLANAPKALENVTGMIGGGKTEEQEDPSGLT